MKTNLRFVLSSLGWMIIGAVTLEAQTQETQDMGKLNSNAALTISVPSGATSTYATVAWGLTYGVGYNLTPHHALIGEIMWNSLYPTSQALAPIRDGLGNHSINGHGNLVALTANYRLQFEGHKYGTYVIAGGGLYYRQASLSQSVTTGNSINCSPEWLWWGFSCSSGVVSGNQTVAGTSSGVGGGNVGIGLTVRLPDSKYKFYLETRYHYAPNKGVPTHVIPISVGVRF